MKDLTGMTSPLNREVSLSLCSINACDGFEDSEESKTHLPDLSSGKYVDNRPTPEQYEMEIALAKVALTKKAYSKYMDTDLANMLSGQQALDLTEIVRETDFCARSTFPSPVETPRLALDSFEKRLLKEQKEMVDRVKEEKRRRMEEENEEEEEEQTEQTVEVVEEHIESDRSDRRSHQKLRFAPNTVFRVSKKKVLSSESIIRGCAGLPLEETLAGPEELPAYSETVGKYLDQQPWKEPAEKISTGVQTTPPRPNLFKRVYNSLRRSVRKN